MIAVDGSPLVFGPRSVARVVRGLIAGWSEVEREELLVLLPGETMTLDAPAGVRVLRAPCPEGPRRFRQMLPALLASEGAACLFSPWSAAPHPRSLGMRVLALIHELPFVRGVSEGALRTWRHRRSLVQNVRRGVGLVVPTEATAHDVRRLHPGASDLHVIPNPFDPTPWRAARRTPATPPYAVMVGVGAGRRMAHKKGLDTALAAWRRKLVPEGLRLVLVGEPALPLVGGVEARPDVDDEALHALVAGASLLIYPSRSEGFGYPPLEALAAGIPVVAGDVEAVREVACDGALYVPPGNPQALAEGIGRVLGDESLRDALLAEGEVRAAAFPPGGVAQALVEAAHAGTVPA